MSASRYLRQGSKLTHLHPHSKVWDSHSGACITTLPHHHIVRTVDLSASGTQVLSGGAEKKLRLWDLNRAPRDGSEWTTAEEEGGVEEFRTEQGGTAHEGTIKSACFDEKRDSVISMGEDQVVRCALCLGLLVRKPRRAYWLTSAFTSALSFDRWWDLRTRQATHSINFSSPITSMEKSHDGELLAITSGNDVTFLSLES